MMKLALGTVQFGLDYGVSNQAGKVDHNQVGEILSLAAANNIAILDTAIAYGESERSLGQHQLANSGFELVSKIPSQKNQSIIPANFIEEQFTGSIERLGITSLYGLLLHDANDLLGPNGAVIYAQMRSLKAAGKVKKTGVSVYSPEQANAVLNCFSIDLIQLPLNCLDQRFITTGLLEQLNKQKVEVHCRSAFLQGLLLMEPQDRPNYFKQFTQTLAKFDELTNQYNCDRLTLALAFLLQGKLAKSINKIVVGCCNKQQLHEIIKAYHHALKLDIPNVKYLALASNDQLLINPVNWPQLHD